MKKILYIGLKQVKNDNVAETKLVWTRGAVVEVHDDTKAAKLCEHTDIWRDVTGKSPAEIKAMLRPIPLPTLAEAPKPRVQVQPHGGSDDASPFWDPIVVTVDAKLFADLQDGKCDVMIVTKEDIKLFERWKKEPAMSAEDMEAFQQWKRGEQRIENIPPRVPDLEKFAGTVAT